MPSFFVPQGAEERAVRRAVPRATVVAIRAGASAANLPAALPDGQVVVLGLCGALRDLRSGACVIYRDAVDDLGRYTFDAELLAELHAALPAATLVHACTIEHVVTRATERAALAAAYGADVVDMESTHLVRALALRGHSALVVRIVSDDAAFDLPPIEDAFAADGNIRPLHLARAFAAKPRAALRFIGNARRALTLLGITAALLSKDVG
jgi:hypothetical protein